MKKDEVKIGGKYHANVTGKRVEIQIDSENHLGGWNAVNLATGKKIRIKSAQRLHGAVGDTKTKKMTSKRRAPGADDVETPQTEIPATTKRKRGPNPAEDGRMSAIDAALKVLGESGMPMNAKTLIDAMAAGGYWSSPGGKTPHATLHAAIMREIKLKGNDSRFAKVDRGQFAVATRGE